ncbi:MAG: N-acetylmuramoyl-L-alanine amidase [Alphaproteobacteria bacterium]
MDIQDRPSPNFNDRPEDTGVDMVVLHYTGMPSGGAALDRMCDPAAKVSAHYMIDEDGTVYRLVAEDKRAWHAGVSCWQGATDINDRSVGIEIVNPGHEFGYRPFPEPQMAAVESLLGDIVARHGIAPARVVGHSDIAPARKQDPGELFGWQRLAATGLAIWPDTAADPVAPADVPDTLAAIGYDPDAPLADAITAFQRRFVPHAVSGEADFRTRAMIAAVAAIKS